jgi:hypothetical protein
MTRNLQRRLQKLESQVPQQPTEQERDVQSFRNFLMCAMAYYLGDPGPNEAPYRPTGGHWDIRTRMSFERPGMKTIRIFMRETA